MNQDRFHILYEDSCIIVCVKPHGIATQSKNSATQDMESLLKNHIAASHRHRQAGQAPQSIPYLAVIHRLDQPVEGILVFAKTPAAAKSLNCQLQNRGFGKYYRALVESPPPEPEGILEDYLVKDGRINTSQICSPNTTGAKLARLHYQIVKEGQGYFQKGQADSNLGRSFFKKTPSPTELEISLDTGRHHQIRVQLANMGCPIIGDTKYNPDCKTTDGWQELKLSAYRLSFRHPTTQKEMSFSLL